MNKEKQLKELTPEVGIGFAFIMLILFILAIFFIGKAYSECIWGFC